MWSGLSFQMTSIEPRIYFLIPRGPVPQGKNPTGPSAPAEQLQGGPVLPRKNPMGSSAPAERIQEGPVPWRKESKGVQYSGGLNPKESSAPAEESKGV